MKTCLINDCNCNEPNPAPCCLDCSERDVCPDRCQKTETTFCVGVIEEGEEDGRSHKKAFGKQRESAPHQF